MSQPKGIILLVEDDPNDEALTLRALGKHHIANPVVVAHDGVEALDWLFRSGIHQARDPVLGAAVVLLDLKLPRLDGLEVLRRMRADDRTRNVPTVILTSSSEDQDIIQGYENGANSFVRKPVEFDAFLDAVGKLGIYWLLLNERPTRG